MKTGLTGGGLDKQVTEVDRKEKQADSQGRHVTVGLFVSYTRHTVHTPVPPAFQTQRERTEPDKHTDKHQPD